MFSCRDNEVAIRLRREATNMTPIVLDDGRQSCESIIPATFTERHPLHQRRHQFFNFQQATSQDTLEGRECLLILIKATDIDHMGQEDIACMMQNCFWDTTLKAKPGAVKNLTLAAFNEIIESHEAGKKASIMTASANVIKHRGDKGRNPHQQSNNIHTESGKMTFQFAIFGIKC